MAISHSRLLFDLYSDKGPRSNIRKIKWESCERLLKLDKLSHRDDARLDQIGLVDRNGDGELSLSEFKNWVRTSAIDCKRIYKRHQAKGHPLIHQRDGDESIANVRSSSSPLIQRSHAPIGSPNTRNRRLASDILPRPQASYSGSGGTVDERGHDVVIHAVVPSSFGPAYLQAFQSIFNRINGDELGHGRDVRSPEWAQRKHKSLRFHAAWRIDNSALRDRYLMANQIVALQMQGLDAYQPPPANLVQVQQAIRNSGVFSEPVNETINEVFLLHGTSFKALSNIIGRGLDCAYTDPNSLFGRGMYFADTPVKTDQYATVHALGDALSPAEGVLFHKLFGSGIVHPGHLHYVLLCRVILGRYDLTDDGQRSIYSGRSIWANGGQRTELSMIPNTQHPHHSLIVQTGGKLKRFPEYISYHNEYVYPAFLLAYQRMDFGIPQALGGAQLHAQSATARRMTALHERSDQSTGWSFTTHHGMCGQNCPCCRALIDPRAIIGICCICISMDG